MNKNQRGFSYVLVLVLVLLGLTAVGGGVYVYTKQQSTENEVANIVPEDTEETVPNGTARNAVNAVSAQLDSELKAEDTAIAAEETEAAVEESLLNEVGDVANEANL